MGHLIYSAIASLDGYVEDAEGRFDWAAPDEEVHAFVNDQERPVGTYLYGRRMYETMRYWETVPTDESAPAVARDYAQIWRQATKIVFSRTLRAAQTARTSIERSFDADAIRRLMATSDTDLSLGGAELAGQALGLGLVDELRLLVVPVVVGGGSSWLPTQLRLDLELVDSRRFAGGVVYLAYRLTRRSAQLPTA